MTEDNLVERLRGGVLYGDARLHNPKGHDPLRMEAADRIEALTAENERLRETLARVCLVKQHTMNPAHTIQRMQQIARAALEGKQ